MRKFMTESFMCSQVYVTNKPIECERNVGSVQVHFKKSIVVRPNVWWLRAIKIHRKMHFFLIF